MVKAILFGVFIGIIFFIPIMYIFIKWGRAWEKDRGIKENNFAFVYVILLSIYQVYSLIRQIFSAFYRNQHFVIHSQELFDVYKVISLYTALIVVIIYIIIVSILIIISDEHKKTKKPPFRENLQSVSNNHLRP